MLWKLAVGFVAGAGASGWSHAPRITSLAAEAPTLDTIMDPSKDLVPIRAVIVGGGYSGSRLAYQLDSFFDVTLIDEKNFFELTNDIIPILAVPWDDAKHKEACRRMMVLHRYYLKRSNVLTGTVDGVGEKEVYLADGRHVPYDLLYIATGEKKPYPFRTQQRTISGRVQELQHFNTFLQSCKKVAVVGGGPVGTSLAHDLASSRKDLEVHLFHSRAELLPRLPAACRRHALQKLETNPNLHLHLASRVEQVNGSDASNALVSVPPPGAQQRGGWLSRFFTSRASSDDLLPTVEPVSYSVVYDQLAFEKQRPQSIISQVYFGKQDAVQVCGDVQGRHTEGDFDYVFSLIGDTPRPIPSGRHQRPNVLQAHETPDGHYRVSTLMQFYGHPNWFGLGRCTNFPVLRGYGSSDIESRTLFRAMNTISNNKNAVFLSSSDGLSLSRMKVPRQHVRLGVDEATGCTPWSGGITGVSAVHEFMQDRNYLTKDFTRPVFYKQQDPMKVKQKITQWLENEITDVVDFSHC